MLRGQVKARSVEVTGFLILQNAVLIFSAKIKKVFKVLTHPIVKWSAIGTSRAIANREQRSRQNCQSKVYAVLFDVCLTEGDSISRKISIEPRMLAQSGIIIKGYAT
jgi:hypothetical protein